jgi:hypothetical protein
MAQQKGNNSQKQQQKQEYKSEKERQQDIKNAAYIASIDQPNHPNT